MYKSCSLSILSQDILDTSIRLLKVQNLRRLSLPPSVSTGPIDGFPQFGQTPNFLLLGEP